MRTRVLLATTILLAALLIGRCGTDPRRPNIVIIRGRSRLWGVGAFGAPNIRTPRLDDGGRRAEVDQPGVQPVCSRAAAPSPAGCRFATDVRHTVRDLTQVFRDNAAEGLPLDEVTAAELLKSAPNRWSGTWASCPSSCRCRASIRGLAFRIHDMRMTGDGTIVINPRLLCPEARLWDVPLMQNDRVIERPGPSHRQQEVYRRSPLHRREQDPKSSSLCRALAAPIPLAVQRLHRPQRWWYLRRRRGGARLECRKVPDAIRAAESSETPLVLFMSDTDPGCHFVITVVRPATRSRRTTWKVVWTPAIFLRPGTIRPGVVTVSAQTGRLRQPRLAGAVTADGHSTRRSECRPRGMRPASPRAVLLLIVSPGHFARTKHKAHFITSGA